MLTLRFLKRRSVHLLVSLLALVLLHPFAAYIPEPWGHRVTSLLTSAVMLTAVWWTAQSHHHRIVPVILVSPAVVTLWLRQELGPFAALGWMLFCFYVIARLFTVVLERRTNAIDRTLTAISVFLLIAMTFAYLHVMVYELDPSAYSFPTPITNEGVSDMLYFSLVTILALGFGDIVPVNPVARMLTVIEAFVGAFFIAILIARLVSLDPDDVEVNEEGPGH